MIGASSCNEIVIVLQCTCDIRCYNCAEQPWINFLSKLWPSLCHWHWHIPLTDSPLVEESRYMLNQIQYHFTPNILYFFNFHLPSHSLNIHSSGPAVATLHYMQLRHIPGDGFEWTLSSSFFCLSSVSCVGIALQHLTGLIMLYRMISLFRLAVWCGVQELCRSTCILHCTALQALALREAGMECRCFSDITMTLGVCRGCGGKTPHSNITFWNW